MPKTNQVSDRAHVIMSFDLNQRDFDTFVSEVKRSKFFPNLVGLEVKRPNYGNPVIGLGALLLRSVDLDEPMENTEDENTEKEGDQDDK